MQENFIYISNNKLPVFPVDKNTLDNLTFQNENAGVFMIKNNSIVGVCISDELYERLSASAENSLNKLIDDLSGKMGVDLHRAGLNSENISDFLANMLQRLCKNESLAFENNYELNPGDIKTSHKTVSLDIAEKVDDFNFVINEAERLLGRLNTDKVGASDQVFLTESEKLIDRMKNKMGGRSSTF